MDLIGMGEQILCAVGDRSEVGEARRRIAELADNAGLGEQPRDKVSLIVSELGTNLLKYGGGGTLLARAVPRRATLEVLALDKGPGMANVEDCFRDGHSTAGSSGTGLGAVRRIASFVDVYSQRPGGTVILARVDGDDGVKASPWAIGAVRLAKDGEDVCGDSWTAAEIGDGYSLMVADGLGHGLGAADAAHAAVRCFEAAPALGPGDQISAMHLALRGTRGAAVAVARVNRRAGVVAFAGVGNVAGCIVGKEGVRQLVSLNGTAGHNVRKVNEFTYPWPKGALLVMHTDGLGGRWDLSDYPELSERDPSVVAGVLYRDYSRGRDDVTVVAARERAA
jgi:anti-sigma regulatory factor (Ser/Thr protein kinase)